MAERRMVALTMVDSDAFLELTPSAQSLYFHLNMRADDDGFVNKPKSITRMVGCKESDLQALINGKFLIAFPDGIVVIKHWLVNNLIRKDRYTETVYREDKALLDIDDVGVYHLRETAQESPETSQECGLQPTGNQTATTGQPTGNQTATQVRLGKDRLINTNNARVRADINYNSDEVRNSFKDPAVGEEFASWLDVRYQRGNFPYGAAAEAISQAKQAEQKYGPEKCIDLIKKSRSGAWTRIPWEDLEKQEKRAASARSGTTVPRKQNQFNQFQQNHYDFGQLEKQLMEGG